jgi:hypothetical protein
MWVQVMDGDGTQRSSAPNTLYSYDGQSPERPFPLTQCLHALRTPAVFPLRSIPHGNPPSAY